MACALDQGIESNLVNGVTTVSARGRYFSILPWAIGQYYKVAGGVFKANDLYTFLTRVEFLIIAASAVDRTHKVGGAILGSDVYADEIKAIRAGGSAPLPLSSKNSRILNIYFNTCKSIGLLDDGSSADGILYRLTERGKAIFEARTKSLEDPALGRVDGTGTTPAISASTTFARATASPSSATRSKGNSKPCSKRFHLPLRWWASPPICLSVGGRRVGKTLLGAWTICASS